MPHSSLSRRSSQTSSSPATGIELRGGLVEEHQPRAARERRAERDALQLATAELVGRAVEQRLDPQRERHLLHAARHGGPALAAVLQREGELMANGAEHDLRLGVLEEAARHRRDRRRPVLAGIEAADHRAAAEDAAVEVRHEAARGAQQRGLAAGRQPGENHELARLDDHRHITQRRPRRPGVGVRHAFQREHAHGSIPRRSRNGASATTISAPASSSSPLPIGACSPG